jgi:hypothetical protein
MLRMSPTWQQAKAVSLKIRFSKQRVLNDLNSPWRSCSRMIRLLALPPFPVNKLCLFLSLPMCHRASLLMGQGGCKRSQIVWPRESLALYKLLSTLCLKYVGLNSLDRYYLIWSVPPFNFKIVAWARVGLRFLSIAGQVKLSWWWNAHARGTRSRTSEARTTKHIDCTESATDNITKYISSARPKFTYTFYIFNPFLIA